jgi:heme exporter protein B
LHFLLKLELRQRSFVFQSALYALSTAYIASLSFPNGTTAQTWNGLLWITLAFNSITANTHGFDREAGPRYHYLLGLVRPESLFLAKCALSIGIGLSLALLNLFLFSVFLGWPAQNGLGYMIHSIIGAAGFGVLLTTTSALASRTGRNLGLMAVLSLPLLIPSLLIGVRGGERFALGLPAYEYSLGSLGLGLLAGALGYLLFPYLWRD